MPASENPPKRLIVPGAENEPPPGAAPRIVLPGPEPPDAGDAQRAEPAETPEEPRGASRIVLPPGVSRPAGEDIPEYPKLRPLILMPVGDGEREMLLVQDPLGVVPGQPVLGLESLALLQLFDGTASITDITAILMRENKDLRMANMVRDFVARLDELLMLDSPRFQSAYRELRDAYHALEIRQAAFDGRSYPADPEALRRFLDGHYAEAEQWLATEAPPPPVPAPRALMAPHLDPRRAGPLLARSFLELDPAAAAREPLRVVVFGTGHSLMSDLYALTRKHFETPLGKVECDLAFVDAVAVPLGDAAYHSELVHRDEHSIEFQAVYLRHRLGDRAKIVPILCGGFHALLDEGLTPRDSAEFEALIQSVRDAERRLGGRTMYVAAVDLSHVGPRFGDPAPDERTRAEVEAFDREALEAARLGDADAWFQAIAAHDDATRICGFAPTYAMLRCAEPGPGRQLRYLKSDEKDGSFVSVASMAW